MAVPARSPGQPGGFILRASARTSSRRSSARPPAELFAIIAFWTGAGGWIIVLYGALNTISTEVMEAAKVDGAGPIRIAR